MELCQFHYKKLEQDKEAIEPSLCLYRKRHYLDMKSLCCLERCGRLPQNGQRIPLIGPKGNDIFLIHFSLFLVSVTDTSSRIPGMGEPGL